jgi:hypothetical protein
MRTLIQPSLARFGLSLLSLAIGTAVAGPVVDTSLSADGAAQSRPAAPSARPSIDPAALSRAQSKMAHAKQVVERFSNEAASAGLPDTWRLQLLSNMMQGPESAFSSVESATNLSDAELAAQTIAKTPVAQGAVQPKVLGSTTTDLTFVPIAPCRIVDTRASGAGGVIPANSARLFTFNVSSAQGSSSCSPSPYGAYTGSAYPAAEAVNITVDETGLNAPLSYLAVYPDGGSQGSSWMNYSGTAILANAGIMSINQSTGKFNVFVTGPTQAIIDVFGVFVESPATALDCTDVAGTSTALAAGTNGAAFAPACASGYTRVSVSCIGSSYSLNLVTSRVDLGACTYANPGGATSIEADSHCCRIPGR